MNHLEQQKHPDHICRFNDAPQNCDCYAEGHQAAIEECVRVAEGMLLFVEGDNRLSPHGHGYNTALTDLITTLKADK
jgi:hypothetical protein